MELSTGLIHAGTAYVDVRPRRTSTTFAYNLEYLARRQAYAVDPGLPLENGSQHVSGIPGAFRDASPDRWGRHIIARRRTAEAASSGGAARSLTDRDFLLGVSDLTRQGALRFRVGTGPHLDPDTLVPPLVSLPKLLAYAREVDRGHDNLPALKALLAAGTGSLGGARPKAAVMDGQRMAIAKFPHDGDGWNVIGWEAATLELAARAGINVPTYRLEAVTGAPVLILDRFDRNGEQRTGYVSAMTMLQESEGAHADYFDLLDVIDEQSDNPRADRAELFRRIAFNIVVNNTDDHLRNHGFLRTGSGWRLSPSFDVNPTPAAGDERVTAVDGAVTRDAAMNRLMKSSAYFVDDDQRDEILARISDALSGWRSAATAAGISTSDQAFFAPLFDSRPEGYPLL